MCAGFHQIGLQAPPAGLAGSSPRLSAQGTPGFASWRLFSGTFNLSPGCRRPWAFPLLLGPRACEQGRHNDKQSWNTISKISSTATNFRRGAGYITRNVISSPVYQNGTDCFRLWD